MLVPNRNKATTENHRYGFNGKERDDEVKGEGNSYDFGARMYDPRISRWFQIDPLTNNFPFESPYTYVSNNPLIYIDPSGKTKWYIINVLDKETGERTEIRMVIDEDALKSVKRDVGLGGTAEYVHDWYDINIVQNAIIDSDGSFKLDGPAEETLGDRLSTTFWDWGEGYVNKKEATLNRIIGFGKNFKEKPSKWSGGIAWYSKNGQGEEVQVGEKIMLSLKKERK